MPSCLPQHPLLLTVAECYWNVKLGLSFQRTWLALGVRDKVKLCNQKVKMLIPK